MNINSTIYTSKTPAASLLESEAPVVQVSEATPFWKQLVQEAKNTSQFSCLLSGIFLGQDGTPMSTLSDSAEPP